MKTVGSPIRFFLLAIPLFLAWSNSPQARAASWDISMTAYGFVPNYLEVTVGDRVYWWNDDSDFLDYHSTHSYSYAWNSGPVPYGSGVYIDTTKTGSFDYIDDVGFSGSGTLVIKPAGSPPIPAPNRVDMVYDSPRDVLYITTSNAVLRYQLGNSSFLSPFQINGNLKGIDLSPDGNTLIVADSSVNSSNVWVYRIDLPTEQITQVPFTRGSYEAGTFAVAFGGDGAALITARFSGSGSVPLRRYDPVTGQTTTIASINQDSMVSASGDGSTIILAQSNSSGGPFNRYDVALRALIRSGGDGWYNYECAANRDGSLFAIPTYGSTFIYNGNLNQVTNIGVYAGQQPVGAAFHPSAEAVFFPFAGTTFVRAYNTATWELLSEFDCAYTFASNGNHAFDNGRIRISRDGEILFVTVGGGVRYFRHDLSLPQMHKLVVAGNPGPIGTPSPIPYGMTWLARNTNLTIQVSALVETNGIRFVSAGWTGTGSVPASGTTTSASLTLLTNSTLTWNWSTNQYQLTVAISGSGTLTTTNNWYAPGTIADLTATPGSNYVFIRWVGNVPACIATNPTLSLTMDQPRALTALFAPIGGASSSLAGDWTTFGNGPAHTGYFPGSLGNANFSIRWVTNISGLTAALQQVCVGGGKIFVTPAQSYANSYLAAIYETNGQPAWTYNFVAAHSINPPTYDGGNVFVQRCDSSTTALWNFNATTGATNWVAPHGAQFEDYFAPTVAAGSVWVNGGTYGGMYGFNETNGAQLFFQNLEQYDRWDPTYYNGKLYTWVAGNFRQHDPQTGVTTWSTNLTWALPWSGYSMNRTVAVADGFAYFNGSSAMFGIDLAGPTVAWQVTNTFTSTPAVANGVVYSISGTSVLAYSRTGQYLGSFAASSDLASQPIVTDDVLIVASSSETFVFDLCTHNPRQTLPVGGFITLANGVLYVATATGQLYAYTSVPPFKIAPSLLSQSGGRQIVLRWPSVADKSYNVWFTPNLSSPFTVISNNVPATPPFNTYQQTITPGGSGYYRIEAK